MGTNTQTLGLAWSEDHPADTNRICMAVFGFGSRCYVLQAVLAWADLMNQSNLIPIFKKWMPDVFIWDGESAHRSKAMGEVGFERIFLLPYSPELNLCERVFEWLRAKIEGEVYRSIEHKRHVIEQHLRRLSCDKIGLRQIIAWEWIQEVFFDLPLSQKL